MIILRHLRAESFKGLRSVDLTFPERGSILIEGHNEAGKSTLFEAVYVALYGEPLVGEDTRPRQEEVIQHGQQQALVELRFAVGVDELTVERVFRRGQPQRARLTIRRPDGTVDTVSRVSAVNQRILDELNNLDGDNLRNSCFVEQKELGRLEDMDSGKREQAIQKLLGLERLTRLGEQFKFRREQERALHHAKRLLDLAHAQADVAAAAADERTLAERLDATLIAVQLAGHGVLETEQAAIQQRLAHWAQQEHALRDRLTHAERLRTQLDACRDVEQQLEKAATRRESVEQLTDQVGKLDVVERETQPAMRVQLTQVEAALKLVVAAERQREAVRTADTAAKDAQRAIEALDRAEKLVRQRVEALNTAKERADQHRQEAQAARERNQRHLRDLEARQARLEVAHGHVTEWERVREEMEATQTAVLQAEEHVRTLAALRATLQQQEVAAQRAAQAETDAERARQQAETHRREAEGRTALQEWVRLKEVEARLSDFVEDRTALEDERRRAADARSAARVHARTPLLAATGTTLLAALALAAGTVWPWAFALGGVLTLVALLLWISYARARAALTAQARALDVVDIRRRELTLQYQAAVQAGGDPALLSQRERELAAAGIAVPPSLDAARALLADLSKSGAQDHQQVREVADAAVATAVRLGANAQQAREQADQTRSAIREVEASGNADVRLRTLQEREAIQRKAVEAAAAAAQEAVNGDVSWPASSAEVRAVLAACSASQSATQRARAEQETATARAEREDTAIIAQAEQAHQEAEDAAAAVRTPDPRAKLIAARAGLATADDRAHVADTRAQLAAQHLNLTAERAAVEAERGRVEERLWALEQQIATRPALASELNEAQAVYAQMLRAIDTALAAIRETVRPLAVGSLPSLITAQGAEPDEHRLTNAVSEVRAGLESRLAALNEPGAQGELERVLHEKGTLAERLQTARNQLADAKTAIRDLLTVRGLSLPAAYTPVDLAAAWPLTGDVIAEDKDHIEVQHEEARNQLFAARDRERRLSEELEHPGAPLDVEECNRHVRELVEERDVCQRAAGLIQQVRERIARQVLPTTERNMQLLLPELTARRYWSVRLTPSEGEEGQLSQLDYRIRVWDQAAGRFVAKNLFSGGTRDQCSLALRLAFALATLPQELGVAPGFIFLDEPLSAFDAQRAQALVDLLTTGIIAQQFAQIVVISHHHAFDRRAFQYHVRMEGGQVVESDLPETRAPASRPAPLRLTATVASPA